MCGNCDGCRQARRRQALRRATRPAARRGPRPATTSDPLFPHNRPSRHSLLSRIGQNPVRSAPIASSAAMPLASAQSLTFNEVELPAATIYGRVSPCRSNESPGHRYSVLDSNKCEPSLAKPLADACQHMSAGTFLSADERRSVHATPSRPFIFPGGKAARVGRSTARAVSFCCGIGILPVVATSTGWKPVLLFHRLGACATFLEVAFWADGKA